MTSIFQRAKFFSGGTTVYGRRDAPYGVAQWGDAGKDGVVQPAILEVDGLRLFSATPKSAAEALRINEALDRLVVRMNAESAQT